MKLFLTIFVIATTISLAAFGKVVLTAPPVALIQSAVNNLKAVKMQKEIWKDVADYEGFYQVSNLGNVRSLGRTVLVDGYSKYLKGIPIKPHIVGVGYLGVMLHRNGKGKHYYIHILVGRAFIPNPENKKTINHKKGNKKKNGVADIEWNTHKENSIHAVRNGLIDNYKPVIQYDLNGSILNSFKSITEAQNKTSIPKPQISAVCNGHRKTAHGYIWKFKNKLA